MIYPYFMLAIESESDREFMELLYITYYPLMYAVARKIVYDHLVVEDLINDSFLLLLEKIPLLQALNSHRVKKYVVVTVQNTALNYLKASKRESKYTRPLDEKIMDLPSDYPEPDEALMRNADVDELKRVLLKLNQEEAMLLKMRYYSNMNDKEIGKALGVGADSVRVYLSRARRKAYALLTQEV